MSNTYTRTLEISEALAARLKLPQINNARPSLLVAHLTATMTVCNAVMTGESSAEMAEDLLRATIMFAHAAGLTVDDLLSVGTAAEDDEDFPDKL